MKADGLIGEANPLRRMQKLLVAPFHLHAHMLRWNSRVFYFRAGEAQALYLSSADWMSRNMMRRVEVAWPVENPSLRQRIIDEYLTAYLMDQRDAWCMNPQGRYQPVARAGRRPGAQQALTRLYMTPGR